MPDLRNSHAAGCHYESQGTSLTSTIPIGVIHSFITSPVIRMFGIFTHAQLDHGRFWDSLSQQLQQRGSDYIKRCTFRTKPLSTGDNVVLPAVFPPLLEPVQDIPQAAHLVKVREEDMKNVSMVDGGTFSVYLLNACANRFILCWCKFF